MKLKSWKPYYSQSGIGASDVDYELNQHQHRHKPHLNSD